MLKKISDVHWVYHQTCIYKHNVYIYDHLRGLERFNMNNIKR